MHASAPQKSRMSARAMPNRIGDRFELAAIYGAFALITAIVFGTLSVHPF